MSTVEPHARLNAHDVAIRWLLPMVARALIALVRSQHMFAVALAYDDGADERHGTDEEPDAEDRIHERERRVGLVVVVEVVIPHDEEGDVYESVQVGNEVQDGRDEEEHCGLERWAVSVRVDYCHQCCMKYMVRLTFFNT